MSGFMEAQAAAGAISARAVFVGALSLFFVTSLYFICVKHRQPTV